MDVQNYLVTLGIRPAELSGLKELPGCTKDKLTPLVLLAPWLATTPLSRALDKFEESFPSRPYFIDIDTYYQKNEKDNEAKQTWKKLADTPADLDTWWSILSPYPNANPCLLLANQSFDAIQKQIKWARINNRIFCLRFNLAEGIGSGFPDCMNELVKFLLDEGAKDYVIVFEFGWVQNPLHITSSAAGFISGFFQDFSPEIPITVSCTSFPKDFTRFNTGTSIEEFTNRKLISEIRKNTNHPKIIYSDWGTTRPRSYQGGGTPKNRIDFPTENSWIIAREGDHNESFHELAKNITTNSKWLGNLGIWGEQLIEATAEGQKFAINTIPKMIAARINIHLHVQAFYEAEFPSPEALDEEWDDSNF
ncbi:MAG: beta family protein [Paracoccaceae bacterium]|nr:beta family protein [Paracoccaceae bacterium]